MIEQRLKDLIKEALSKLELQADAVALEHPVDLSMGDYSTNVAMALAKSAGMNPRELAEKIVAELDVLQQAQNESHISKIQVAGPGFINFYLSKEFFVESVKEIIEDKKKTISDIARGQTWAVEYASPNPNKAMHLGHLRNVLTGISVCRILEANGAKVIREMVDNNRGIAISKLMWGYLVSARKDGKRVEDINNWYDHQDEWQNPGDLNINPDRFVDELYVKGASECKDNPEIDQKVRDLVIKWEAKDPIVWSLWERVLSYAYAGQKTTLDRLGAKFDFVWHEHEHYEEGKKFVEQGLSDGIFKKTEDGAVVTSLDKYNMPDTIVVKRDGTALYITQDIALTDLKKKTHKADKMIWIIGPEQSLAMAQMFAVCEQLGIGKREEFVHLPYGYMSIKGQGKMSSRSGNVIYIDDILDEAKSGVKDLMQGRVPESDLDHAAEQIGFAAIAFGILKSSRLSNSAFDLEHALRLDGDTGPYLQYAAVRAGAILEKAKESNIIPNTNASNGWQITSLEKYLYRFPEVVIRSCESLEPHHIATYLIELARTFNAFYANTQIVAVGDETAPYKVALTAAFSRVMKNGLWLLGIEAPEKM